MFNFSGFRKILLLKTALALGLLFLLIFFYSIYSKQSPVVRPVFRNTPRTVERIAELRGKLSNEGRSLRSAMLQTIRGEPATLYETTSYRISYLPSPDIFYVEIRGIETEQIKQEVMQWFQEQGFSSKDICGLPVVFYVGGEAFNYFKQVGGEFDPLPPGCVIQ